MGDTNNVRVRFVERGALDSEAAVEHDESMNTFLILFKRVSLFNIIQARQEAWRKTSWLYKSQWVVEYTARIQAKM